MRQNNEADPVETEVGTPVEVDALNERMRSRASLAPAAQAERRPIMTSRVGVDENARVLATFAKVREAQRAQQRGMATLQRAKAAVAAAEADVADLSAALAEAKEQSDDAIRTVKANHDIPGDGGWDDVTRVINRVPRK